MAQLKLLCRLKPQQLYSACKFSSIPKPESAQIDTEPVTSQSLTNPLDHPDYFGVRNLFTLRDLFQAQVHLGHKDGLLDPHMKQYLYGIRQRQCILDLEKTVPRLQLALNFAAHVAYNEGIILLLNRTPQFSHLVERTAVECGEYAHTREWQGGCFTNAWIQFGPGTRLPDLLIFFHTLGDAFAQHRGIRDAAKMNIPSIGIVDSNADPCLITYPVPGNDDSPAAMELYCRLFKTAILRGKQRRKEEKNM